MEGARTGVGRYLENILRELVEISGLEKDFKFIIYTKEEDLEDDFLQSSLFEIRPLRAPYLKSSFTLYFNIYLPLRLARDQSDFAWFPSYIAPLWSPKPFVVTLHDLIFERFGQGIPKHYLAIYKTFCPRAAKRAEKIFTVSEFSKKEINNFYEAKNEDIKVTPLASAPKFRPLKNKDKVEKAKEKYGLNDDYIFYLGQIFNRRFGKETFQAFKEIVSEFKQLQFFFVGKNRTVPKFNFEKKIKELNNEMGYEAVVRLKRLPEEDMTPIFNGARAFIYLSSYEGFGMPPLEAMACGTPVITTNKTSLAEVVDQAALLVSNPEDKNEIAEKMRAILTKNDLREKLKKKGLNRAAQFDWEKTAKLTLKTLREL